MKRLNSWLIEGCIGEFPTKGALPVVLTGLGVNNPGEIGTFKNLFKDLLEDRFSHWFTRPSGHILQSGANPKPGALHWLPHRCRFPSHWAILYCSFSGHEQAVKLHLSLGCNINIVLPLTSCFRSCSNVKCKIFVFPGSVFPQH